MNLFTFLILGKKKVATQYIMHTSTQAKLEYIQRQVIKKSARFRVLPLQAIECVLALPPANPMRITKKEMSRINGRLIIPLHPETIAQILDVASEYEENLIGSVNVVGIRKNLVPCEDFNPARKLAV